VEGTTLKRTKLNNSSPLLQVSCAEDTKICHLLMDDNSSHSSYPGGENPWQEMYDRWISKTPFVTRCSLISIIVAWDCLHLTCLTFSVRYILMFFLPMNGSFGNIPYYTLFKFQIYRILLAPLVGNTSLSMLMIGCFYPAMGTRIENSLVYL
jgi:hypothetical protein